ncbi:MAG: DNA polymerase III subunit chi [Rhodobacteraceae bacterium]|nr:DNA polymerase III subunit chi [Paracoccaceae bacterium]
MGAVYFYHLTREPLDRVLPMLLERSLAQGWRVAVRGTDRGQLERLDEQLWLDEGFLPHGLAGGAHDADQPVLLTTEDATPNAPACLMSVSGANVSPDEVKSLDRVCIVFDGNDDAATEFARGQWKSLTDAGVEAQYWSQETGRWTMKAQANG